MAITGAKWAPKINMIVHPQFQSWLYEESSETAKSFGVNGTVELITKLASPYCGQRVVFDGIVKLLEQESGDAAIEYEDSNVAMLKRVSGLIWASADWVNDPNPEHRLILPPHWHAQVVPHEQLRAHDEPTEIEAAGD